jgi:AraC-like DNA-binding protein
MDRPQATSAIHASAHLASALSTNPVSGCLLDARTSPSAVDCRLQPHRTLWRDSQARAPSQALSRGRGLAASPGWEAAVRQLTDISRAAVPAPSWWTPRTTFVGSIETITDATGDPWDGISRLGLEVPPDLCFQLTLAGSGRFQVDGQNAEEVAPGDALLWISPARHRCYVPKESPGWTFGWIGIYHPYLASRVAPLVSARGSRIDIPPDGLLASSALRLLRGAIKKDFCDRFEVELALFGFVLAYERWAQGASDAVPGGLRLRDEVRSRILANLPKAIGVDSLAAEYGMSRSYFSHFFRNRTGVTPAHFATEVRIHEATRMLLDTSAPLKRIADDCGFANANHFCKVFRRLVHMSPGAYRQAMQ